MSHVLIPLLIWAAAAVMIALIYLLGPKAMLVALVAVLLLGARALWNRPRTRR